MITDQSCNFFANPCQPNLYISFRDYLDEKTPEAIWMLQEGATAFWDSLYDEMPGASLVEMGVEMHRWWGVQIRRLHQRLRLECEQEKQERLKEKLRRERCRRIRAEDQRKATQEKLHQVKDDLMIEREVTKALRERWRCVSCNEQN